MKPKITLRHEFVEEIPPELEDGIVYVSIPYTTALHNCCCGCGLQVVTPLSPTDWKLIFDGDTISLCPSIGNWTFPCRSHYWIKHNTISWAGEWSDEEIQAGRKRDQTAKAEYFKAAAPVADLVEKDESEPQEVKIEERGLLHWWRKMVSRLKKP